MLDDLLGLAADGKLDDREDARGAADRRVKPALLTLLLDQAALFDRRFSQEGKVINYDLRNGFPHRRAVISWYQRAAVRTMGHIGEVWAPKDCVADGTLLSALIVDEADGIAPMESGPAKKYRSFLEELFVQPACNKGYRSIRHSATEYVKTPDSRESKTSNRDLDPTKQRHVAMRPGFQTLDKQQQRALEGLWGGFDSDDDLMDWWHGLNSPTNGEIDTDVDILGDRVAVRNLVEEPETPRARAYQDTFASVFLLPAFVAGVRSTETDELAKASQGAPTTLRMKGGRKS